MNYLQPPRSELVPYVERLFPVWHDSDVVVHSVDSDEAWLQRSVQFSESQGVSVDGFMLGGEWLADHTAYDIVLNDYANGATRERFAEHAANRLADDGAIVFDDAHHAGHHNNMALVCCAHGLTLLDLFHQTIDGIGRFAMIGARP